MTKFKIKWHKHKCCHCNATIQCNQSLLHEVRCDDCHDKKADEFFFGGPKVEDYKK